MRRIKMKWVKINLRKAAPSVIPFITRQLLSVQTIQTQFKCNFNTTQKKFHKFYIDQENVYIEQYLPPLPSIEPPPSREPLELNSNLNSLLDHNFRHSNPTKIVQTFEQALPLCTETQTNVSDPRFDPLIDGLVDHCHRLTDAQLSRLLQTVARLPQTESITSHNFHDLWSCLDDICCWKLPGWPTPTRLRFALLWHRLHLARASDYVFETLNLLADRAHRLDRAELLHAFFLFNVTRRARIGFAFEHALDAHVARLTFNELGLVAMAYFKSQTKIKLARIVEAMLDRIVAEAGACHEIPLAAMLKAVRYSQQGALAGKMAAVLDALVEQAPRLSTTANLHVALAGTTIQLKHEASLIASTERLIADVRTIRVKDIERILLANTMFNVNVGGLYELALEELQNESRAVEFVKYNRCLPPMLHFLSMRGLYDYKWLNQVLDEEWIEEVYGKQAKLLPRELFSLDRCVEIECKDYKGARLSLWRVYKAAKWLTEFTPELNQWKKLSLSDRFYLEVSDFVGKVVGGGKNMKHDHLLPHFGRSDIVLCRNRESKEWVEPFGFENYILGDIKWAQSSEKYDWFALLPLVPNLTVRGRVEPLGSQLMKARQLKLIGYKPIFIYWNEFDVVDSKADYIQIKIRDAIK